VVAFRATEEPDLAFICRPQLAKPPDCEVVFTLGAFYLDGGHGLCLAFLFNDNDFVFAALDPALHLIGVIDLPDIPAFPAFQLASRRYQHGLAFRTEHRYSMRKHRRLTLLSRKIRHWHEILRCVMKIHQVCPFLSADENVLIRILFLVSGE
jgi:hypothetical protein